MKRNSIFNIIIITLLASLVFSCTKLFDKETVENSRKEAMVTITLDANGGKWASDEAEVHTISGVIGLEFSELIDSPEQYGYVFGGWTPVGDAPAIDSVKVYPKADISYKAVWVEDVVEVTLNAKRIAMILDGESATLTAEWTPDWDIVGEWKSSDEEVVTLAPDSENAKKAVATLASSAKLGDTANITITLPNGLKATCQIVVAPNLDSIGEYKVLAATEYTSPTEVANNGANYVSFGTFPQTIKSPAVNIYGEDWDSIVEGYATITHAGLTYYLGDDGSWYLKAVSNPYDAKTFSDGSKIETEDEPEYYFKVEPIIWRIIDSSKKMLLAEKILTSNIKWESSIEKTRTVIEGVTTKEIYASNYKYSNIRAYLNGINHPYVEAGGSGSYADYTGIGFIDIAFTENQQAKIKETEIQNDKTTMKDNASPSTMVEDGGVVKGVVDGVAQDVNLTVLACDNTNDKIFFLSVNEATKTSYGFTDAYNVASDARRRTPTDYALVNYVNSENPSWWLRSPVPGKSGGTVSSASTYKNDERSAWSASGTLGKPYVVTKNVGIVPALCVDIP